MAKQISMEFGEGKKYSPKERMHWHAKQSKVGAVDKKGNALSEFNRGREYQKAEDLGNTLGSFAIKKAAEKGDMVKVNSLKAKRQAYREEKAAARAAFLRKMK